MKRISILIVLSVIVMFRASGQQTGDLDTTFNGTGKLYVDFNNSPDGVTSMLIQNDEKIIVIGYTSTGSNYSYALTRFFPSGVLDTSFGGTGKVVTDFAPGYDFAATAVLQPDGKIIAAGNKWTSNHGDNSMVRYNTDGSLDSTFGINGKVETPIGLGDGGINSMVLQPDGKIVVATIATNFNSNREFGVIRFKSNGDLDSTFGTNGKVMMDFASSSDFAFGIGLTADNKIVVAGATGQDPVFDFGVLRLDTIGALDTTFGTNGFVTTDFGAMDEWPSSMLIQADGKILVSGYSGSPYKVAMVRYNDDGTLDNTFNGTGKVLTSISSHDEANGMALQQDGKIVLAGVSYIGTHHYFNVLRYDSTGVLDPTFSTDGWLTTDMGNNNDKALDVAIQQDGKIVVAGNSGTNFAVARYITDLSSGLIDFATMNNSVLIYPNPVADHATLQYELNKTESITISLYDLEGRLITNLIEKESKVSGLHTQQLDFPSSLTSGTYLVTLSNGENQISIKIIR